MKKEAFSTMLKRCRRDPAYRKKLEESPQEALAEVGIDIDADTRVEVHQDTPETTHYVLPGGSPSGPVDEEALRQVAGGVPDDVAYGYGSSSSYFAAEYRSWQNRNKRRPGKPRWGNYRDE